MTCRRLEQEINLINRITEIFSWPPKHPVLLICKVCWIAMYIYIFIGYSNINNSGEGGLAVMTILFMMSLPISLIASLFQPILVGYFDDRTIVIYLFVTGYLQWFVILPYIIKMAKSKSMRCGLCGDRISNTNICAYKPIAGSFLCKSCYDKVNDSKSDNDKASDR